MVQWRERWVHAVWATLGCLTSIGGFLSENTVTIIIGAGLAFASVSAIITSYVKSEHLVKRASEVVFGIIALGIFIYGYILTGSLILGIITLFIAAMFSVAFTLSYLLPKIRNKNETDLSKIG